MNSKRVVLVLLLLLLAMIILTFFVDRLFPLPDVRSSAASLGVPV